MYNSIWYEGGNSPIRNMSERGKAIWRTSGEDSARQRVELGREDRRNN